MRDIHLIQNELGTNQRIKLKQNFSLRFDIHRFFLENSLSTYQNGLFIPCCQSWVLFMTRQALAAKNANKSSFVEIQNL